MKVWYVCEERKQTCNTSSESKINSEMELGLGRLARALHSKHKTSGRDASRFIGHSFLFLVARAIPGQTSTIAASLILHVITLWHCPSEPRPL